MTLIEGRDYHVELIDFPPRVHEAIYSGVDHFTIFLNARDSYARRMRAFRHALKHAERGDFRALNVQVIELSTHGGKHGETA